MARSWEEEWERRRLPVTEAVAGAITALAQELGSEDAALDAMATDGATVDFAGHVLNEGMDYGEDRRATCYIEGADLTGCLNAWRQGDRVDAAWEFEAAFFSEWGWQGQFASITTLTVRLGHVGKA